MNIRKASAVVLLWSFITLGCDSNPSGYSTHPDRFDEVTVCSPRSTGWIRHALIGEGETEEEQLVTQILILGHSASPDDETGADCLYLAQLDYEGSVLLYQGRFALEDLANPATEGAPHRGTWTVSYLYDFIREPDKSILARRGARRSPYPLPEGQVPPSLPRLPMADEAQRPEREIAFYREGNRLSFTVDGETEWFEELGPLLSSVDPGAPGQLEYLVRAANLGLLVSQVRVIGFGAAGITGYRAAKDFAGLTSGILNVGVDLTTEFDAELDYQGFSDIPGLTLDGPQLVDLSPNGDGQMNGSQLVELSMDGKSEPFVAAEIDYSGIVIKEGFGAAGTLLVASSDEVYGVDATDALVVDFRGLLAFDPPKP